MGYDVALIVAALLMVFGKTGVFNGIASTGISKATVIVGCGRSVGGVEV